MLRLLQNRAGDTKDPKRRHAPREVKEKLENGEPIIVSPDYRVGGSFLFTGAVAGLAGLTPVAVLPGVLCLGVARVSRVLVGRVASLGAFFTLRCVFFLLLHGTVNKMLWSFAVFALR